MPVIDVSRGIRVAIQRYAPGTVHARHAHEAMSVSLVLAGSLSERVGRRHVAAGALSIVVKPGGVEHANDFGARGARLMQVGLNASQSASVAAAHPALTEWGWHLHSDAVPAFLALLAAWRRGATADDLDNHVWDVLAGLNDPVTSTPCGVPHWLSLVIEQVNDSPTLTVRDLARSAEVHPVYLARQFRRYLRCSITDYRRRHRVVGVADRLASPSPSGRGESLSRIALEAGFYDQPHLCRDFRRETGISPAEFRRLAHGSM